MAKQSVKVDGREFTIAIEAKKKTVEEFFCRKPSTIIGIIHFICAAFAMITGVFQYLVYLQYHLATREHSFMFGLVGTGIWTGSVFLAASILNLKAGNKPHKCNVIAAMVLGILSTIAAVLLLTMAALELGIGNEYIYTSWARYDHVRRVQRGYAAIEVSTSYQILVAIVEFFVGIVSAILSCKATCCKPERDVESRDIDMPDFLVKVGTSMGSTINTATAPATNSLPDYESILPNYNHGKY